MCGVLKKKLIFSIYTDVNVESEFADKRNNTQKQFKAHWKKLYDYQLKYSRLCNADHFLATPSKQDYDDLNVYKIKLWEQLLDKYDAVMYLDLDVIPLTEVNIFEKFDFSKLVTYMCPTPLPKFTSHIQFFEKEKDEAGFIETLDKYHWLVKTKQKNDMLLSQLIKPKYDWMMNTGTFGGSKHTRNELKFSERLDEVKSVVDEVLNIDDRYFHNNETMLTYMVEKYNLDVDNMPQHWHQLILSDDDLKSCRASSLIHVITKDFESVFKNL